MDEVRLDPSRVRTRRHEATQALLGDTIGITDEQWQAPSRLPGWTRAHVATHLARNADGLTRVIDQLVNDRPTSMYDSPTDADWAVEAGSSRSALELQTDLDASAGRLHERLPKLTHMRADRLVPLTHKVTVRLDHIPIVRLNELVVHHVDLNLGFGWGDVCPEVATWLLDHNARRVGRASGYPAIRLRADSGFTTIVGGPGRPITVEGPDHLLLGWLTGRLPSSQVDERLPELPVR